MSRQDFYHEPGAPKANRIVPAVSAIVQNNEGEILLHLRSDNAFWSLPGGGLDIGENVSQAIIREVWEETGLNVVVSSLVGIYSDPEHVIAYSDGEVRQQFSICFFCKIESGEISISDESKEVRFFKVFELAGLKIHPANAVRIRDFLDQSAGPAIR